MDIKKLQALVVDALEDVKAQDIRIYDTMHLTSMFDRIAVASGTSNRQTKALAASVRDKVKAAGGDIVSMEGETTGEWVLVDLGDMVVHIMQPAIRAYYRLEELWGDKEIRLADARRGTDARKPNTKKATEPKSAAGDSKTAAKKTAKKTPKPVKSATGKAPASPAVRTSKTASKAPAKAVKKMTGSKTASKTAAKSAAKPATKSAARAPAKSPAKTAAKKASAQPAATKRISKASTAAPVKATQVKKAKLVRDSFTIPKNEYVVIDSLKKRAIAAGQAVKKSELLRAGIKALAAMSDVQFMAALSHVPPIKTGRPKKSK